MSRTKIAAFTRKFYKSIQNFYNRMFQELSEGQLSLEGRQAAMALAFIGEHIRRLDTKPDGNSTTIRLGNGELLEVPTFSSGNFVRGTLQAQEGDGAATTPFGIYALIDWAEEVIRPRSEGQPVGIHDVQGGMDEYWQTSLGVLVAGMAVAMTDGSLHTGDMATSDQGQATGSRRQKPNAEIRDATAKMRRGDSSSAVNHIAEAIGIDGAYQTIVDPNPASLSGLASAANELGMEINVPSPIDGRDIGFKELLGELAFVENTIKQNRRRLEDEGIEIPSFSVDTLKDINALTADQRRRVELADGKDIFDVFLIAGDIPQVQEAIGDRRRDWQAFEIGFLAHDDTGFDLGTGGVNADRRLALYEDGGNYPLYLQEEGGNVGIGVPVSRATRAKLDVSGSINIETASSIALDADTYTDTAILIPRGTFIRSNTTGDYQRNLIGHNGTTGNGSLQIGQQGTSIITDIIMYPGSSGNIRFYPSGSEDVIFTSNGRVGIGNTSPKARLQVEEYGIETTETSTSATTQTAIHTMSASDFRSARFTIQVTNSTDSTYHTTEILMVHDGTTANITEFGKVFTANEEATFTADISSGNLRLLATPATTDSMEFKVVCHSITV